jgi:hypothetical protein
MVEHPLRGTLCRCASEVSQAAAGSKNPNPGPQYGSKKRNFVASAWTRYDLHRSAIDYDR